MTCVPLLAFEASQHGSQKPASAGKLRKSLDESPDGSRLRSYLIVTLAQQKKADEATAVASALGVERREFDAAAEKLRTGRSAKPDARGTLAHPSARVGSQSSPWRLGVPAIAPTRHDAGWFMEAMG